jgi:hypothetical protein
MLNLVIQLKFKIMENSVVEKKKSLLERILDGAIDAVKRPFVIKRVERAFSSASDSLEEQVLGIEAKQTTARENLVSAAKSEGNLSAYIQKLVDLQIELESTEKAQKALSAEKKEFLN